MKILIIKTGAMGDVVRCLFLGQAFYDKYKDKKPEIYWLTNKNVSDLFINNSYIKETFTLENKESLKDYEFDIILNIEEDEELAKFVNILSKKELIGFIYESGKMTSSPTAKKWFDMSLLGKKPQNDILKLSCKDTHRKLMSEIINVSHENYEPHLRLNEYQLRIAENFKKMHNFEKSPMILGLFLGGADRWKKSLPINLTITLIDEIYKKFKCTIILFGGPNEQERNKEIISKIKSPIIDGRTDNSLKEFIALISVCNYFISTDTLALHLALGLKKKTICLLGPTVINEKEDYIFSRKVVSKARCVNCLKRDCTSMEKISIAEVIEQLKDLSKKPKLGLVITSYKEPKTARAIESILNQKIDYDYDLIVSAPDKETLDIARNYSKRNKRVKVFQDQGKGKNLAFNELLNKFNKEEYDLLIFTDGDVYLGENSINEIANIFWDSTIGCVTGRPVPEESRETKFGYFANFLFNEAHKMRENSFQKKSFLECSGYLFAFRNKIIKSFPLDTAEDTIIPYYFWEKGYDIGYAKNSLVFVKNVTNWKDWIKQKTRTSISHENLNKYVNTKMIPRAKTFFNEAKGAFSLFSYAKNFHEFIWSFELMFARLYMWSIVIYNKKIEKKEHSDNWERIESTK